MVQRKVIADSEDEDEVEDATVLHPEGDAHRPEYEPLSPHHQPSSPAAIAESHHQISDVTDPSFFANIYDNQQSLAAKQLNLIENIVRQSQRASASSGDISLPAKTKGRKANPSSGTDVTSPMVLSRPQVHTRLLSDGASEFTTPRKSMGQEWEIPSSAEGATTPHSTKGSRSDEKTYGKRKRRRSKLGSSPVAAKMFAAEETIQEAPLEDTGVNDQLHEGLTMEPSSTPMTKRRRLSQYDSFLPDTTKFYVAQSTLTTMQRLEYQKVNVSTNGYGGLPGSLSNHKSSGATTIAYSTPSGYSSVPPLPWEESPAAGMQPASPQRNEVINITSSPDVFASGYDFPKERSPAASLEIKTLVPYESCKSPTRPQSRTPVSKGKKRAAKDVEEDELGQDNTWDLDDTDLPQERCKPRATKRRSTVAASFSGVGTHAPMLEAPSEEPVIQTQVPSEAPVPALLDTDQSEAQPKKRGRKKKQPVTETPHTEMETTNEDLYLDQNAAPLGKAAETEPSIEKPKKKRGRPRKLEPSKATEEALPESPVANELPKTDSPHDNDNLDESAAIRERHEEGGEQKANRKKSKTTDGMEGTDPKENRLPLKEMDSNSTSPSKPGSLGGSPTKTRAESKGEKLTPIAQLKETPKLSATQSKVTYRVGLSRRSRIAPLLKSIKK
ncbi:hypothetical protein HD806DRAFT_343464 [Xylariaceae sp. AK1471]|nr:hypothetical protein HD806DRAFT_343464 [Xylariaceae sp. AK1471]